MLSISSSLSAGILAPPNAQALVTDRVRKEFRDLPGLTLTLEQAVRLWSLDAATCIDVMSRLTKAGFLCRRPDGAYCRASDLSRHSIPLPHA